MNKEEKELVKFCLNHLDFSILDKWPMPEYCYKHLSLCAIDAVFSINTRYTAVEKIINRIKDKPFLTSLEKFQNWLNKSTDDVLIASFNRQTAGGRPKNRYFKGFYRCLVSK